jgi:hypothetical protein
MKKGTTPEETYIETAEVLISFQSKKIVCYVVSKFDDATEILHKT